MAKGVQKAWSVTAADNDDSDETTNWAEGQAPSTVNNSARAMMAAVKAFANQIAGGATYGGSSNAYTITSDSPGTITTAYAAGMMFMLKASHTNNGAATLNVDGVGAVAIKTSDGGDVVSGDIVQNGLYLLAYNSTGPRFDLIGTIAGGSFQPLDATLTAFAALSFAADKLPYGTGTDAFALADLTSFGRSLIDDADAAAARTTLGLVIGTNVQAYDAQLADVAGLTPTDNAVIIGNGTNFVAESGATLLTSIGLGTGDSPQFTAINFGHASNTTLSQSSAGHLQIESNVILDAGNVSTYALPIGGGTLTGDLTMQQNDPLILFNKANGTTNQKIWGFDFGTDGQFSIFVTNDAFSVFGTAFSATRSTTTVTGVSVPAPFSATSVRAPEPLSSETSGTLSAASENATVKATGGITINDGVFAANSHITVYNDSDSSITITQDTGMTLRLAGTTSTGSRTLLARGIAVIYFDTNADAAVGGTGVT